MSTSDNPPATGSISLSPTRSGRRRRRRIWLVVAIVLLACCAWTGWELFVAVSSARAARPTLQNAVTQARAGNLTEADRLFASAGDDLARGAEAAGSPPLRLLSHLPVLGENLDALRIATEAGERLVNDAARPMLASLERVRAAQRDVRFGIAIEAIAREQPTVEAAAAVVHQAAQELNSVDAENLIAYQSEFATLQSQLSTADRAMTQISTVTKHLSSGNSLDALTYLLSLQNESSDPESLDVIQLWTTLVTNG